MNIIKKIKKKVISICRESYFVTKNFGLKYGSLYFITSIFRSYQYRTRCTGISILQNKFSYLFDSIDLNNDKINYDDNQKNIFLYWAQGFDDLPDLQKNVLNRIYKYYSDCNIVLIDDKNYSQYVTLSENIKKLYNEKKISVQTFSDILRFNLIYKYGGVWCDMTIFFFERFDFFDLIKKNGFWSINHNSYEKKILWERVYPVTYTTFLFGSFKGNDIMKICVDFYTDYYEQYDFCIDYFMNDFILIMCMKMQVCDNMLNKIPFTTSSPFLLSDMLNGKRKISLKALKQCPQKINNKSVNWLKLKKLLIELEGETCVI